MKETCLKLSDKMKSIPIKTHKIWVLCQCPECEGEFIAKLTTANDKDKPENLFNLEPLPEDLTCPYCGIKNDVYAIHFPLVEL